MRILSGNALFPSYAREEIDSVTEHFLGFGEKGLIYLPL